MSAGINLNSEALTHQISQVLLLQPLHKKSPARQKAISEGFAHQRFSNAPRIAPLWRLADRKTVRMNPSARRLRAAMPVPG